MNASKRIKTVMKDKGITDAQLAELTGKTLQTVKNTFYKDRRAGAMRYANAEQMLEAMGCEIIIRDKETGREY